MRHRVRLPHPGRGALALLACVLIGGAPLSLAAQIPPPPGGAPPPQTTSPLPGANPLAQATGDESIFSLDDAMVRLPLAAVLGAALALRPKRRGTPDRSPAVIETQIILAVVGALIMLIVGANLARAFGIVGAANLIRYRSKIEDPKDAVVMLSALSVGLASGVGYFSLALFATVFLVAALWVIESFEPQVQKYFDLQVKLGENTDEKRGKIEAVLARYRVRYELRTSSDEAVAYQVKAPVWIDTKQVTDALLKLDSTGHGAVEWTETKTKTR